MDLQSAADSGRRKHELRVFIVLAGLLAPVLAVTAVGGYGLAIWTYQMIAGPPGPPAKATPPPRAPSQPNSG
jgi:nitrate reductase NapE